MVMDLFNLVRLGGGLSLFIFGIHLLSKGLEKYAGAKLQSMIERLTNRPIKGFFVGTLTTATLQSSSLTMVTVIGLINAGIMSFQQAIGVILGTEIGTTITAQLVAFDIGEFYFIPIIFGTLLFMVAKKFKYKYLGQAILGFGLLFMGMGFMSASMAPLADEPFFVDLLSYLGVNILLAVGIGALLTAVVQSSSVMVGSVIAMSMSGIISLPASIGIILGANLGTCFTSIIASLKASLSARRAATAQIIINLLSVLIFLPFVYQFSSIIQLTSPSLPRQIANAHTALNLMIAFLLLPFSKYIVKLVEKLVPGEDIAEVDVMKMRKEKILKSPELALKYADTELKKVLDITVKMLENSRDAILESDKKAVKSVWDAEPKVDRLRYVIEDFLDKVSWIDATEDQLKHRMRIAHNTTDMERVGDHAENIANYADERIKKKVKFSYEALMDLGKMFEKVIEAYKSGVDSITKKNQVLASKTIMIEEEIDDLYWSYRDRHISRLEKKVCSPQAEEIFSNVMRDLERIGDHADNLAKSIIHQLGDTEI
jgi:phosphate:Na+ symporter